MGRLTKKKPGQVKKKKRKTTPEQIDDQGSNQAATFSSNVSANRATTSTSVDRSAPKASKAIDQDNVWGKSVQFFREVRMELKKVTWPTRKETVGSTAVVIVLVMIVAGFLGLVDAGLSGIIRLILG